jgi:cell division protein FtsB
MTKADLGLPSDSKAITYQQNRENDQLKAKIKLLETRNHVLENDNRRLRTEVIERRMKDIKEYRETREPFMEIAM